MGYTHYWKFKKNPKDVKNGAKKFEQAVELFKKGLTILQEEHPTCVIAGGMGEGEPVITNTRVWFNGKANDDYETFCITFDDPDYDFNFCKTAYRPYDPAVCLALLCFKHCFRADFSFSSDGSPDEEGWVIASKIFQKLG